MESNHPEKPPTQEQTEKPPTQEQIRWSNFAICSLIMFILGVLGILFFFVAFMYALSFGNLDGIGNLDGSRWLFKVAFVSAMVMLIGLFGSSLCGVDIRKLID
jgi:heme/copper-type cytochrome/quinol oxidase subunit 2